MPRSINLCRKRTYSEQANAELRLCGIRFSGWKKKICWTPFYFHVFHLVHVVTVPPWIGTGGVGQSGRFIFSSTILDIRYNVNNSGLRYPPRAFGLIKNFINESRSRDVAPDRRRLLEREYLAVHKSFKKYWDTLAYSLPHLSWYHLQHSTHISAFILQPRGGMRSIYTTMEFYIFLIRAYAFGISSFLIFLSFSNISGVRVLSHYCIYFAPVGLFNNENCIRRILYFSFFLIQHHIYLCSLCHVNEITECLPIRARRFQIPMGPEAQTTRARKRRRPWTTSIIWNKGNSTTPPWGNRDSNHPAARWAPWNEYPSIRKTFIRMPPSICPSRKIFRRTPWDRRSSTNAARRCCKVLKYVYFSQRFTCATAYDPSYDSFALRSP